MRSDYDNFNIITFILSSSLALTFVEDNVEIIVENAGDTSPWDTHSPRHIIYTLRRIKKKKFLAEFSLHKRRVEKENERTKLNQYICEEPWPWLYFLQH